MSFAKLSIHNIDICLVYSVMVVRYGSHTSGIITTPSDHLMIFCILESNPISIPPHTKFREVEKINQHSINNFIHSLENSNLMTKIDTTLHADPNKNYDILALRYLTKKQTYSKKH